MFDKSRVFAVAPADIDSLRPWVEPFLTRFAAQTTLVGPEDVIEQVKRRDAQLWSYHDGTDFRGVVVTRIRASTIGRLCNIWVCVGFDADELIDGVLAEIEGWARGIGCYAVEIVGRKGWSRKLAGYKQTAIVLEKRLAEVH